MIGTKLILKNSEDKEFGQTFKASTDLQLKHELFNLF
jgi:hypothetical protein